jgi:hypothetical protein
MELDANHRRLLENPDDALHFNVIKLNLRIGSRAQSANIIRYENGSETIELRQPSVVYTDVLHHSTKEQSESHRSWDRSNTKIHFKRPASVLKTALDTELKQIEEIEIKIIDFSPIDINLKSEFLEDDKHEDGLFLCGRWAQSSTSASRAAEKMSKYYQSKVSKPKSIVAAPTEMENNAKISKKDKVRYLPDSNGKNESIISDINSFMGNSSRPASSRRSGKNYLSSSIAEYHEMEAKIELAFKKQKPKSKSVQSFSVGHLKKKTGYPINEVCLSSNI